MSVIGTLITNREAGAKYNCADLNRVESAFQYLGNKLNDDFGFNVSLTIKTDWKRDDLGQLGSQALMEQYRQNLVVIRDSIKLLPTTPQSPDTMRFLTAQEANNIEKVLINVEELLNKMPYAWKHSGTCYAGQGGLIR